MHESTVSRVTSNKYLSCDRGLYELKYFFTSGIQSSDGGDAASSRSGEEPDQGPDRRRGRRTAILSDDQLVEMLKGEGFDIARRTVAKYREAIGLGQLGAAAAAEGDRAGGLGRVFADKRGS